MMLNLVNFKCKYWNKVVPYKKNVDIIAYNVSNFKIVVNEFNMQMRSRSVYIADCSSVYK